MSILAKYNKALEAKDEAAMNEIIHDDYKFLMHASGKTLSKSDVIKWGMSGDINRDRVRIIYENDEIGVEHSFVTSPLFIHSITSFFPMVFPDE